MSSSPVFFIAAHKINKHNNGKNPNRPETNQLAIYKCDQLAQQRKNPASG